jgi:cytochrome c-type biogenesis protein
MLVLAAASTGLRLSIGAVLVQTAPVVNSLLIVFGILLILSVNIWNRLPAFAAPRLRNPVAESYGFGLLYGPIVLPCNAPLVLSVIALSTTLPDFFSVFAVYVVFGLGLGLPLLLLSVLTRAGQQWLVHQFTRHHRLVNVLAGAILVGIGVYDFVITFRFLSLFLP